MVHSRDNEEVGVAHKVISPKNQPQFSPTTMRQYWLGKTKLSEMLLKNYYNIKKNNLTADWLTNQLMPSD